MGQRSPVERAGIRREEGLDERENKKKEKASCSESAKMFQAHADSINISRAISPVNGLQPSRRGQFENRKS
jgi:hypothetical protein